MSETRCPGCRKRAVKQIDGWFVRNGLCLVRRSDWLQCVRSLEKESRREVRASSGRVSRLKGGCLRFRFGCESDTGPGKRMRCDGRARVGVTKTKSARREETRLSRDEAAGG